MQEDRMTEQVTGKATHGELASLLAADAFRHTGRTTTASMVIAFLNQRTFRPVATLRLCQALAGGPVAARLLLPMARVAHRIAAHHAGMDLPWRVTAGPGLCILHGWGLVVAPGATIGSNVTLFHGVTLGRRDRIGRDSRSEPEYPTIEDEVWIGPHAIVVGGVTVGTGSRIGGGSFVTTSIPARCIVGGNPAEVLKTDCTPDVFQPAPFRGV
jgi:serine O-acetyltransferase